MKIIIAGGRNFNDFNLLISRMNHYTSQKKDIEVVSGTARGADKLGEEWAKANDYPITHFPADWKKYGKMAGPQRNQKMAEYADALVAFWDGESSGTRDMIARAKEQGLKVRVVRYQNLSPITSFRGEHFFLSNFYPASMRMMGQSYLTSEHAFQAHKTINIHEHEIVRRSATPKQAKALGYKVTLRPDWNEVKLEIMERCLRAKFNCNPDLAQLLIATGSRELVEGNTWNDTFWGVSNNKGENHLGKLLMKIRGELNEANELSRTQRATKD